MVEEGADAFTVDDDFAVFHPVKVGAGSAFVEFVGFVRRELAANILDDAIAFADRGIGEHTGGVYTGRADGQGHATNFAWR